MTIFDAISLAGGLGLFLYGMTVMGTGLERLAGSKLEIILKKLTSNVFTAVIFGTILTAAIQSSSATTVIVVGLVNSGIMKLEQAIGVIMGANIGTTVTAQILSLSDISGDNIILKMMKPANFSPIVAIVGAVLFIFIKSEKSHNAGQIMMGFSILFTGMFTMEHAVSGLRDSELFITLFTTLENPILGVLAGAGVTALIQSSSASIGILQALASTGIVTWGSCIPILLGQNIGTCVTPMLASIGASKGAKRAAFTHLYFNVIGTSVFLIGIYTFKAFSPAVFWGDIVSRADIAAFHTMFNVIVTLAFIPFTGVLAKVATWTVRNSKTSDEFDIEVPILDTRLINSPGIAVQQARGALETMALHAKTNYSLSVPFLFNYSESQFKRIDDVEKIIDKLEVNITNYLVAISEKELNENDNKDLNDMLGFVTEFERIGDYAMNVTERSGEIKDKNIVFSESAKSELYLLNQAICENLDMAVNSFIYKDAQRALPVEALEETIDLICEALRSKHIERLKQGTCAIESGVVFLEILTNLERVSDHCSNIAGKIIAREYANENFDSHAMSKSMRERDEKTFDTQYEMYKEKYYNSIFH